MSKSKFEAERPMALPRFAMPSGTCLALSELGKPCRCYAVHGQAFCRIHLKQGYGLFTLAVLKPVRTGGKTQE